MDPNGKVAIVTGGGTGLGKVISLKLAAAGATVAVNYPGVDEQEANATATEIVAAGGRAIAVKADVSVASDVARMVEQVAEAFGGVDILVNNAGATVFVPFVDLEGLKENDWNRVMAVNLKGPFLCVKAVVPYMRRRGAGVIVNTTSGSGIYPTGSSIVYSVSKAGLQMLTRCLALALGPEIRVNSVAPGLMPTRWGMLFGEESIKRRAHDLPLKKIPEIEDVAEATIFAIHNDSMTGATISIDAGSALLRG